MRFFVILIIISLIISSLYALKYWHGINMNRHKRPLSKIIIGFSIALVIAVVYFIFKYI